MRTTGERRASKTWTWTPRRWSMIGYEAGCLFSAVEVEVADLRELGEVLDVVRTEPCAFVVRGELLPAAREAVARDPTHLLRRLKHEKEGTPATLAEVDRHWIMVDIDGWPLPAGADLAHDPDAVIADAIRELLPPSWSDADCWWQLSSSAGIVPGLLKGHLFFWLDVPMSNDAIKAVLRQCAPGADMALFNAAQPHYVADPTIIGAPDPLPRRTGWREGSQRTVTLPALLSPASRPTSSRRARGEAGAGGGGALPPGGVADALDLLGDGDGLGGYHEPLRTATMRAARDWARHEGRDDGALKEWLRAAILAAPRMPGRDVGRYMAEAYLDGLLRGAVARVAGDPDALVLAPYHAPPTASAGQARTALAEHVAEYFNRVAAWHAQDGGDLRCAPEHAGLRVGTGLGKSTAARAGLGLFIEGQRAARLPHRVLWTVPRHDLSAEVFLAMGALGVRAAVLRGREAQDPDTPAARMCGNLDAVGAALRLGADVERSVCGGVGDGPACPLRTSCAYQKQKLAVAEADVVIAAHQSLFSALPAIVSRDLAVVVVDEAWWQVGLAVDRTIRLASLVSDVLRHGVQKKSARGKQVVDNDATGDLCALARRLAGVLGAMEDGGFLARDTLLAAGLSADDCARAHKLEWARKLDDVLVPGMGAEAWRRAVALGSPNAGIPARAAVWRCVEELLAGDATHTGRVTMDTRASAEGSDRVVLLHTRRDLGEAVASLPMLHLDATLPVEIVRHFLPRLDVLAEVDAVAPHCSVVQVVGGFGKSSLIPSDKAGDSENARREGIICELRDYVALHGQGDALVVTYKDLEERFGGLPGVRVAHYNAVSGLDLYRHVRSVFLVGRPMPAAQDVRKLALALTGRAIAPQEPVSQMRGVVVDGAVQGLQVRAYADPAIEAIRAATMDAQVVQAAGRARGVNRTAADPVTIYVLADVALPMPLARLAAWQDIRLDVVRRMAARGLVLLSPTDAAAAYPDLFASAEAAKKALQRAQEASTGTSSSIDVFIKAMSPCSPFAALRYRLAGAGQRTRRAWCARSRLDSLRAGLEQITRAPLALLEVDLPDLAPAEERIFTMPVPAFVQPLAMHP